MLEQYVKFPWDYNNMKRDMTVEVNILDSDDQAAWSLADVAKYMTFIGKTPDGSQCLMIGNETQTYYLIRRTDLFAAGSVDGAVQQVWATVHHVEIVMSVDPETMRCPTCNNINLYGRRWNSATGEEIQNGTKSER